MASKNNVENRGPATKLRMYNGQEVEPIMYVSGKTRVIAGAYKGTTDLVYAPNSDVPLLYSNI